MSFKTAENGVEDMNVEEVKIVDQPEEVKSPSTRKEPGSPQMTTGATSEEFNAWVKELREREGGGEKKKKQEPRIGPRGEEEGKVVEELVGVSPDDPIVVMASYTRGAIIKFLRTWKGYEMPAFTRVTREILVSHEGALTRLLEEMTVHYGQLFMSKEKRDHLRQQVSEIKLTVNAMIDGIKIEQSRREILEDKIAYGSILEEGELDMGKEGGEVVEMEVEDKLRDEETGKEGRKGKLKKASMQSSEEEWSEKEVSADEVGNDGDGKNKKKKTEGKEVGKITKNGSGNGGDDGGDSDDDGDDDDGKKDNKKRRGEVKKKNKKELLRKKSKHEEDLTLNEFGEVDDQEEENVGKAVEEDMAINKPARDRMFKNIKKLKELVRTDKYISESEDEEGEMWTGEMERDLSSLEHKDIVRGLPSKAIAERTKRIQRHELRFYQRYTKSTDPNVMKLMRKFPPLQSESKPRLNSTREITIAKCSGVGTDVITYLDNLEIVRKNANLSFREITGRILSGSDFEPRSIAMTRLDTWKNSGDFYTRPKDYGVEELKYWIYIYLFLRKDLIVALYTVENAEQAIEDLKTFKFQPRVSAVTITQDCARFQQLVNAIPEVSRNQSTVYSALLSSFEDFGEDRPVLRREFMRSLTKKYGEDYQQIPTNEMLTEARDLLASQMTIRVNLKNTKSENANENKGKKVMMVNKDNTNFKSNNEQRTTSSAFDMKCEKCGMRGHNKFRCFVYDKNGELDMVSVKKWVNAKSRKENATTVLRLYCNPFKDMSKSEWLTVYESLMDIEHYEKSTNKSTSSSLSTARSAPTSTKSINSNA